MLQRISLCILCACTLLSNTPLFAAIEHVFTPGIAIEYEFFPNQPQVYANIFFWPISCTCRVISESESNFLLVKALRKSGSVNGLPLTVGDQTVLSAKPNDLFNISADSGAKVEVTNVGLVSFKASCTV